MPHPKYAGSTTKAARRYPELFQRELRLQARHASCGIGITPTVVVASSSSLSRYLRHLCVTGVSQDNDHVSDFPSQGHSGVLIKELWCQPRSPVGELTNYYRAPCGSCATRNSLPHSSAHHPDSYDTIHQTESTDLSSKFLGCFQRYARCFCHAIKRRPLTASLIPFSAWYFQCLAPLPERTERKPARIPEARLIELVSSQGRTT
jgi:hypothetical protein